MNMKATPLIFEMSVKGRKAYSLPALDVPEASDLIPDNLLRECDPELPEVSELDVVRHFTNISQKNHGVDAGFYPLGSCTMKYNPKLHEVISKYPGFSMIHPYQPESSVQGALELMYKLDQILSEITGMDKMCFQPAAGAHGELTGLMVIKAYHQNRGDMKRNKIIVPDSAHGTNPASAAVAGYEIVEVKSNERGGVDLDALRAVMSDEIAGFMLTNPNTLGIFDDHILDIAEIIHEAGGLLYYDGANANAIVGIVRPGDMGFDVVHLNLHKTFSTPHGGGGPGSGPIGVKKELVPFLPKPVVDVKDGVYFFDYDRPLSIGKVKAYYGNFGVFLKAYAFVLSMGSDGLKEASEVAVLNTNYIVSKIKDRFCLPYDRICMHECVISGQWQKNKGASTLDMAKRLLDFGYHPPTVYFPLIVSEAMMIEPTEAESKETLDEFIAAMRQIADEVDNNLEMVTSAPHITPVGRLDEAKAARSPILRWTK